MSVGVWVGVGVGCVGGVCGFFWGGVTQVYLEVLSKLPLGKMFLGANTLAPTHEEKMQLQHDPAKRHGGSQVCQAHTPAYVSIRQHTAENVSIRQLTAALRYVKRIRQHTSAYVSIRQRTSAYVS
jgi:hypothetical protein